MSEIQKKNIKDLEKELVEKQEQLRKFKFDITGTKITNVKEGHNIKRDIARILTELRLRNLSNK